VFFRSFSLVGYPAEVSNSATFLYPLPGNPHSFRT
jgi:hypothetical protein